MASDTRAAMFGMRVAGVASLASSAIAAVAVVLLVLMYLAFGLGATSAGQTFGGINDALTLLAYVLAVPGVLATAAMLRSRRPSLAVLGALVAVGAIVAIAVLQWQLVTGALTFEQQIGPVSVAFLALGAWFVLSAYLGAGLLPYGVGISVLAALYVGYPLLAFRLGRSLLPKRSPARLARSGSSPGTFQADELRNQRSAPVTSISSGSEGGTLRCLRVVCLLSPRPEHLFYGFMVTATPTGVARPHQVASTCLSVSRAMAPLAEVVGSAGVRRRGHRTLSWNASRPPQRDAGARPLLPRARSDRSCGSASPRA